MAQTPPDADLYYRRTHDGAMPPAGVDRSDHSAETTNVISADSFQLPKSPGPQPMGLLDNGIDPTNLGKGDWIWQMPQTETHLGVSTVQGVIDYEKSLGMQWITVKCGDGTGIWTQFSTDLITRAHAAGLKIFGWAYAYGTSPSGEANVALNALSLGADGFIIDAESEYETLANNSAVAAQYCQAIRAAYPTRFMAHAPFPYINLHSGFPYVTFGVYCDAVMPQDYWGAIGITPSKMITDMDTQWRNWQNSLTGTNRNAIKPIVPLAQSYAPVTGAEITTFVNGIQSDATPATTGGYKGISFWDAQERTADMDAAVLAASIGTSNNPPYLITQPVLSRTADTGASVSFTASAGGTAPFSYRWRVNGSPLPGATNSTYTLTNAQPTNAGTYTIVVTNLYGSVTSAPVSLTVYPPQTVVFSDSFDSNTAANWTVNKSSTDTRVTFSYDYSASGIASAPHSTGGTTRGMKLEANMTAGVIAALSMSPIGQSFSGDYRLHFDMWINVNGPFPAGGSSSTEYLTAGIGTTGNRVQWTGTGTTADGYWFSVDGEGGVGDTSTTTGDYCAYIGTAQQNTNTGIYAAGTNGNPRGNLNTYYVTAFPVGQTAPALQQSTYSQQTGALAVGTVGFAWHDVIVSKRGSTVEWSIDGVKLATVSNATFTGNNVFVGYWDPFASLTDNTNLSFGLVDNVRVEVPSVAPAVSFQPQSQTVNQGSNVTFTVTASGTPTPGYQWAFNSTNIAGATGSTYTRLNAQLADAGTYAVIVTNVAGSVTSSNAVLVVAAPEPPRFGLISLLPDGRADLLLSGQAGAGYLIQASSNLLDWFTLATLINTNGTLEFIDDPATNAQRFYRARLAP
jgi:hypothetical protein